MAHMQEKDEQASQIIQELSNSQYACSSLTLLGGGTVNLVYRGVLARPSASEDGNTVTKTVVVKHSKNHLAGNENFALDVARCKYEETMLVALENLPSVPSVKAPRIHQSGGKTNTLVIQDYPDAVDMKSVIVSSSLNSILTLPVAKSIGHALGSWLRAFHHWASLPAQADLRKRMKHNVAMQNLKRRITYDSFIGVIEKFPEVLEGNRYVLEAVKEMATREFEDLATGKEEAHRGIIHGDFWMGNVLASDVPLLAQQDLGGSKLVVIDWEFAQFGHWSHDLGQMIGDIYERYHFNEIQSALWIIEGFIEGYGEMTEGLAYRTAIHVGIQLLGWYNRRAPTTPVTGTPEQIVGAVELGTSLIVKGWEKDRAWFEDSMLAPLFRMASKTSDGTTIVN